MISRAVSLVVSFVLLNACSNKLGGELEIDGQKLTFDSCRSGQVYGFTGVELIAKGGRKLRLVGYADNSVRVLVGGTEARFDDIGECGPVKLSRQNSTINDVTNVEGNATLDCSTGGHTIKGKISWENCH